MAGTEKKSWIGGSTRFGVGDELTAEEQGAGPLLPLRLLVVADLTPRDPHNAGASPPDAALRVDPSSFDDLFAKLRLRIAVEVPSVLREGKLARVDLAPTSLKSFRPDGLCAEVPLLRSLLDGRLVLERLRDGGLSREQAEAELDRLWGGSPFAREVLGLVAAKPTGPAPEAPAAAAPEANIDALLAMVDLGGQSDGAAQPWQAKAAPPAPAVQAAPEPPSQFASLIGQVVRAGRAGSGGVKPAEAIVRVEKALGAQIGAILQHPEVRRLEQALRGLRFLADRAQGHTGVRLEVVSARPDDAAAAFERAIKANVGAAPPVSCAVVDVDVDGTAASFARLEAIAAVAEAYNAPALVNGAPKLLGVDDLSGVEGLDNKAALFTAPARAPWRAAASKPSLQWVVLAMNGVLGRLPYDKTTSRVREAVIKELPDDAGALVWLSPAYVTAALVVGSFRDTGWPCRIVGGKGAGVVSDLPVREVKLDDESDVGVAIPTEAFISTDTQRELSRLGVLALASAPNSDAVYVQSAPTAYVTPPRRTYDSATTEPEVRLPAVPLGDQLFVSRVVQFLRAFCGKLPAQSDPEEVQPVVEGALWALFEGNTAPGSLELSVKAEARGGETVVAVAIRPRRFLGVGLEEVSLEVPLG